MATSQQGGDRQRTGWRRRGRARAEGETAAGGEPRRGETARVRPGTVEGVGSRAGAGGEVSRGRWRGPVSHEIRTGKPQVKVWKPSHVPGVREGNSPGSYKAQDGHLEDGTSTARRSTGINARSRDPIDPSSPNLSPA